MKTLFSWVTIFATALLPCAYAKETSEVKELQINVDPAGKVRPFETAVVQVRVYGRVVDGEKVVQERARFRRAGAKIRVLTPSGGWLSKPFAFQGRESEAFYQEPGWGGIFANIGANLNNAAAPQDCVLYTAPEKPGKYEIEATLGEIRATVSIEVDAAAPSRVKPEELNFEREQDNNPYRKLAEHYAPFIAQESWWQPKSDMPARFDFDGNLRGDDNWDNLEKGSSQAYVYYAAIETETHWFLIYNVFHARDYSDRCIVGTCHENDNEGLILTIQKDGSPMGKLRAMETLAHNNVYSFTTDSSIRAGVHDIDGKLEVWEGSHPMVFIESGGHGILGVTARQSTYDFRTDTFRDNTGITLVYKGAAERPKHGNDRLVGYDLLPIETHWWARALNNEPGMFDAPYRYQPWGNRPPAVRDPLPGSFLGRKMSENKAKPFWGWHDVRSQKRKAVNTGQWALDPAYSVTQNLRFPSNERFSLDYTYNPYLVGR